MSWHFDFDVSDGVATITFNRPDKLNALTFEAYADLRELIPQLPHRGDARVLVITGEGRGFCSGGDVEEIIGELVKREAAQLREFTRMTGAVVKGLRELPMPVIAAVNGIAAGAGAVLAAASDLRLLAESASFRFLFTRVGISGGDMGICWLLPRLVGIGRATEILLLGDKITAGEALAMGLANRVVPDSELDAAVAQLAGRLREVAPWGLAMTKEMLNRSASMDYSAAIEMEAFTQSLMMTAQDFKEFHAGFTGKRDRKPVNYALAAYYEAYAAAANLTAVSKLSGEMPKTQLYRDQLPDPPKRWKDRQKHSSFVQQLRLIDTV